MGLPKPYYENNNGKLYHGDCLDIMPLLEPVDLVLTDPPYTGLKGGLKHKADGVCKRNKATVTIGDLWNADNEWFQLISVQLYFVPIIM